MGIGEGLGGIVGGFLGNNAAKMDRRHQKETMKAMVEEYKKIGYPPDYAKELILKEFQVAGIYTPEMEADLNDTLAESAMESVSADPFLKQAGLQSLQQMKQLASTGYGAEDRAATNEMLSRVRQADKGSREAILQRSQATGMGGSGAELMALLQGSQGAADMASSESDAISANMAAARKQALSQYANQASGMRQQQYGEDTARAQAIDERNRMLYENSVSRESRNIAAKNQGGLFNISREQETSDKNVGAYNQEKQRQADAVRAQYQDKLNYAAGITGQQGKLADFYGNTAQAKAQAQMDMAKGVGAGADATAEMIMKAAPAAAMSDKNLKNDIDYTDEDVTLWMDRISKILKGKK